MAAAAPHVAVVGGGIAGTLCSLVLKNRGISSTIIDAGSPRRPEFVRLTTNNNLSSAASNLTALLPQLEALQLIAPWKARFGMLGASKGGFLPTEIVAAVVQRNRHDKNPPDTSDMHVVDAGDFCGFVNNASKSTTTYIARNDLLPQICRVANVPVVQKQLVTRAEMVPTGGWRLETTSTGDDTIDNHHHDDDQVYDGLVLTNPSLASATVRSIGVLEEQAATNHYDQRQRVGAQPKDGDDGGISQQHATELCRRLAELANALQKVQVQPRLPLYCLSVQFSTSSLFSITDQLPFDAVSVHGSTAIQFLVREESKPFFNSDATTRSSNSGVWTAIATSQLAAYYNHDRVQLQRHVLEEMMRLFQIAVAASSDSGTAAKIPPPVQLAVTHEQYWEHAFHDKNKDLNLASPLFKEDCVTLAPWRLAIAGDYLATTNSPWEAAAQSGMQAGERVAALFTSNS